MQAPATFLCRCRRLCLEARLLHRVPRIGRFGSVPLAAAVRRACAWLAVKGRCPTPMPASVSACFEFWHSTSSYGCSDKDKVAKQPHVLGRNCVSPELLVAAFAFLGGAAARQSSAQRAVRGNWQRGRARKEKGGPGRSYLRRSWPHVSNPTVMENPGVDGISFTVHPRPLFRPQTAPGAAVSPEHRRIPVVRRVPPSRACKRRSNRAASVHSVGMRSPSPPAAGVPPAAAEGLPSGSPMAIRLRCQWGRGVNGDSEEAGAPRVSGRAGPRCFAAAKHSPAVPASGLCLPLLWTFQTVSALYCLS